MPEAEHAETDRRVAAAGMRRLACSLVERNDEIPLTEGGVFRRAYDDSDHGLSLQLRSQSGV
jgi:hypothetical protein